MLIFLLQIIYYIVGTLPSSAVDCGFESLSDQNKDYKIGICCFSAEHRTTLKNKSKDWLAVNKYNVSEWRDNKLSLFYIY